MTRGLRAPIVILALGEYLRLRRAIRRRNNTGGEPPPQHGATSSPSDRDYLRTRWSRSWQERSVTCSGVHNGIGRFPELPGGSRSSWASSRAFP